MTLRDTACDTGDIVSQYQALIAVASQICQMCDTPLADHVIMCLPVTSVIMCSASSGDWAGKTIELQT